MKFSVNVLVRQFFLLLFLSVLFLLFACTTKKTQFDDTSTRNNPDSFDLSGGIIKEGWIDDNTFQAYIKEAYSQNSERHFEKARIRLAWLLLLEGYQLSKDDLPIAKRLLNSNLFKKMGDLQIFHRIDNGKIYILAVLKAEKLKEIWEHLRLKMEDKMTRLQDLRRN